MTTVLGFKDLIDVPQWRTMALAISPTAAGSSVTYDKRNTEDRDPYIYYLVNATTFQRYNIKNDEWQTLTSPALTGTFGAGAFAEFAASAGPSGVVAAGCTTTLLNLTTALPAAVGVNQLANRGDGIGYRIRVYGNIAGSSGLTEERRIVANTGGTTPSLILDSPLSFTPAAGCRFEILAGRVMLCSAGVLATSIVRAYDIATNSFVAVTQTNLPSPIGTDSVSVMLDELSTPHNRLPGEGFFGNLTSTGVAASTITGHATGGDVGVLANEYRNFQIRIVRDTTTPAAVGQRRIIASHTAGPSPVYTLASAWTTNPSVGALYVIENNNDLILFSSALMTVASYRFGGFTADGTWSVSGTPGTNGAVAYAARAASVGAGCIAFPSFGIVLDPAKNARHSFIYAFRGGGVSTLDLLDVAAGVNGVWTLTIAYGGHSAVMLLGAGSSGSLDDCTLGGRYGYINLNATQRFLRFDVLNRVLEPYAYLPYAQGVALVGTKLAVLPYIDGSTRLGMLYALQSTGSILWNCALQR